VVQLESHDPMASALSATSIFKLLTDLALGGSGAVVHGNSTPSCKKGSKEGGS
jgi:hypothetical protein